jgi:hypothetical protein
MNGKWKSQSFPQGSREIIIPSLVSGTLEDTLRLVLILDENKCAGEDRPVAQRDLGILSE